MLCILGPTASGKTRYAVECAKRIAEIFAKEGKNQIAEIISADSRQVYKDMTIGSGKDIQEYENIPYHLIDIVEAGEKYNLFLYQKDFFNVYHKIIERGNYPILCGGSGLYVEAVCKGYTLKEIEPHRELREEIEKFSLKTLEQIITDLKALKGNTPHNHTDFDTAKRAVRAIEIELFTPPKFTYNNGEKQLLFSEYLEKIGSLFKKYNLSSHLSDSLLENIYNIYSQEQNNKEKGEKYINPDNIKFIALNPNRDTRNKKIDIRLQQRLESGMIEEVKMLLDRGIKEEDLIYYGLEYKFITQYLRGDFSYEYMKEHLAIAIHQFAKRQMTWLRGMEKRGIKIEWIDLD